MFKAISMNSISWATGRSPHTTIDAIPTEGSLLNFSNKKHDLSRKKSRIRQHHPLHAFPSFPTTQKSQLLTYNYPYIPPPHVSRPRQVRQKCGIYTGSRTRGSSTRCGLFCFDRKRLHTRIITQHGSCYATLSAGRRLDSDEDHNTTFAS
jgi:hypothetical protein